MTTFNAVRNLCGLSQQGTADYLGVSIQSVKNWCRGKTAPPFGVWVMMSDLWGRVLDAGEDAAERLDPENMDRMLVNGVQADDGHDPLPDGSDWAAGAVAVLSAIQDRNL